ncbi:helix-turn-helix domain-containing protein [Castellaniella hirudinis]|uniref:helix-turn-helix domain-containing protein n=1 Tax=Castellaniella hirudinis TaxID=1144617 RepID=UPI0039C23DDB
MNAPTNIQIINGADGKPAFVVIPYDEYVKPREGSETYVPHEVVSLMVDNEWSIARAWREHLGVTQQEMAHRLGVTQSAYSQQESRGNLRKASREKIAAALGISPDQLDA